MSDEVTNLCDNCSLSGTCNVPTRPLFRGCINCFPDVNADTCAACRRLSRGARIVTVCPDNTPVGALEPADVTSERLRAELLMKIVFPRMMVANVWDYKESHLIVVPTNVGWRRDLRNPMGAGLSKQANQIHPGLDLEYGKYCKEHGAETSVLVDERRGLILFPVKPLNEQEPNLSWQSPASLDLIERGCRDLASLIESGKVTRPIAMVAAGCGSGNLTELEVLPIIKLHLEQFESVMLVRDGRV